MGVLLHCDGYIRMLRHVHRVFMHHRLNHIVFLVINLPVGDTSTSSVFFYLFLRLFYYVSSVHLIMQSPTAAAGLAVTAFFIAFPFVRSWTIDITSRLPAKMDTSGDYLLVQHLHTCMTKTDRSSTS